MLIDEFLVAIGVKANTDEVDRMNESLERTSDEAGRIDDALADAGSTATSTFSKIGGVGAMIFSALQTVIGGAWAYLDSYIDKVEELQEAEDETIRTTKEQVEMAHKYRENMNKLGGTIDNIKTRVALQFLPTMYELSAQYAKLIDDNKELIANGINRFLEAVSKAVQVVNNVIKFIQLAVEKTIGWKGALVALALIFGYVRRAMLLAFITNPITWVILAITALALLIDDFMTYLDGGESQFGDFWGKFIVWVKLAIAWFKSFWQSCKDGYDKLVNFTSEAIEKIVAIFQKIKNGIIAVLTPIYNYFKNTFSAIWKVIKGYVDIISAIFNFIVSAWNGDLDGAKRAIDQFCDGVSSVFTGMADFLIEQWNTLISVLVGAWELFKSAFMLGVGIIKGIFSALVAGLKALWELWVKAVSASINGIKGFFVGLFNGVLNLGKSFVNGIGNIFSVVTDLLKEPFRKAFDWITEKLQAMPNMIGDFVNKATFGISGKISGAVSPQQQTSQTYYGGNTKANIFVNGAGDPVAVANNVTGNLNTVSNRNINSPFKQ